jgi:hypothetical protein
MEICKLLLNAVPDLRGLLQPATLQVLTALMTDGDLSPEITSASPWQPGDLCDCAECRLWNVTPQHVNLETRLYAHMNTHRTPLDVQKERAALYTVGDNCWVRAIFENILDLRVDDATPRPGFGLGVRHRCIRCATETVMQLGTLEADQAMGKLLPGAEAMYGVPQHLLDRSTGVVPILPYLQQATEEATFDKVRTFGSPCHTCKGIYNTWQDTVLPWS